MSKQEPLCESVCPKCQIEFKFSPIHPLEPATDSFLGSYICECGVVLIMDYEVASQTVIAKELNDWRAHKKEATKDTKFRNIKVEAISKNEAKRKAYRINRMAFKGQFANCYITEVGEDHYTVTLFLDECKEVRDAHVAAVCAWKKLLTKQELETPNEH